MSKSKMIVRTKFIDRACHWTVVICFFLVALSGISFFFPTLQWLTQTFGTPQMGRILHPFFGIAIFVALMFMFVRFVHHNIPDKKDIPWLLNIVLSRSSPMSSLRKQTSLLHWPVQWLRQPSLWLLKRTMRRFLPIFRRR